MQNIILSKGLSEDKRKDIRELEDACCKYERLNMKLNWDMIEDRPADEVNDLLYYDENKLIGFLGLYCIGQQLRQIEVTGMIHPDYRRKGIFRELFNVAKKQCMDRKAETILLVTERSSDSARCFAMLEEGQYSFSEYRMKFDGAAVPDFPGNGILLRKSEYRDCVELMYLDRSGFGLPKGEVESGDIYDINDSVYVAELDGKIIGKIGISLEKENGYIWGFVINPEYRRRGYGREVLSLAILELLTAQVKSVVLEVEVRNEKALQLYESCGFKAVTIYDYYEILL